MVPIRAFVGHSFSEDDAPVVSKFLKYLSQLSEIHPNFSWSHAEPAEPKVLADKVLQLFDDKNLFIGICTKNERVISPHLLRKTLLLPGYLKAPERDYAWKTSDWIIQEIGLARGKNLALILLIEDGLRLPGGLQGNIEHIPFDRSAPEKAFVKIAEMLTALSPKVEPSGKAGPESKSLAPEAPTPDATPKGNEWGNPKPDWKRRDYEIAFFHFIGMDDPTAAQSIREAYLATEEGRQESAQKGWESHEEWVRIVFGKGGQLKKLKQIAEQNPQLRSVMTNLAHAYSFYRQDDQAATTFQSAANCAATVSQKLTSLRAAALAHEKAGNISSAIDIVSQMKLLFAEANEGEMEVLKTESKLTEVAGEDEMFLGTMERILAIDPSDNETRFSLAYKYSQLGNEGLALFHYYRIPSNDRSSGAWNNLGVAYDQLELPAKSVEAYRKSESMGETLAMSNLANKFTDAGFLSEANQICNVALGKEGYHKNVATSAARLRGAPEDEEKKETELLKKHKRASAFNEDVGRALAMPSHTAIANHWKDPDCNLDVTFDGKLFKAVGSYEKQSLSLIARAIVGETGLARGNDATRYKVEYVGKVRGRAIVGTVSRHREGEPARASTLLTSDEDTKVLMVMTDDAREIRVLEQQKKDDPRYYEISAIGGGTTGGE